MIKKQNTLISSMDFRTRLCFGWSPLIRCEFSVCTALILFPLRLFFNASFKHFHASQCRRFKTFFDFKNQWELFFLETASKNLAKYSVDYPFSKQSLAQALIAVLAQKHMQELKGIRTDFLNFFSWWCGFDICMEKEALCIAIKRT